MDWDRKDRFKDIRLQASQGQLVTVRADGQYLLLPGLKQEAINPQMIAQVERFMPPSPKRDVAAIGNTDWAAVPNPTIQVANQSIPFFGLLMGLATIGHSIWIFNGEGTLLEEGCRDVLIVDNAQLSFLPHDWQDRAKKGMRNPQISLA